VAELADGVFPAGEHSLHWNGQDQAGRDLPSGVYMVQMVTERTVRSSKMTLVR
jgi:flagellar hook assembly protein FlgD